MPSPHFKLLVKWGLPKEIARAIMEYVWPHWLTEFKKSHLPGFKLAMKELQLRTGSFRLSEKFYNDFVLEDKYIKSHVRRETANKIPGFLWTKIYIVDGYTHMNKFSLNPELNAFPFIPSRDFNANPIGNSHSTVTAGVEINNNHGTQYYLQFVKTIDHTILIRNVSISISYDELPWHEMVDPDSRIHHSLIRPYDRKHYNVHWTLMREMIITHINTPRKKKYW